MMTNDFRIYGSTDVERLITDLTIAVQYSKTLSVESKNDISELLSVLLSEIDTNEHNITPLMRLIASDISSSVASTGLVANWDRLRLLIVSSHRPQTFPDLPDNFSEIPLLFDPSLDLLRSFLY
jgi:hypothetical protein